MPSGGSPKELVALVTGVALPLWYQMKKRRREREALHASAIRAGVDPEQAVSKPTSFSVRLAFVLGGVLLVAAALALYGCVAGQPADLKCSLIPCYTELLATMTANQKQAFHGCMKRKRQENPLALGPVLVTTLAKQQRDYDNCVSQASAAPSAVPSPSPAKS
jgi:hypothetical protein